MSKHYDFAVIGAGILGLAHAYHLAKRGHKVLVLERGQRALGASVRNFGMVWPVGQAPGEMRDIAVRSREIWLELLESAGIWHQRCGSLHLAYQEDELEVLEEFAKACPDYGAEIISAASVSEKSPVVRTEGLRGAMWSPLEVCVNPRTVIASLPSFLRELGVEFRFGVCVTKVEESSVWTGQEKIEAGQVLLCAGDDFETLFPGHFAASGLTRSKLQMMKARPKDPKLLIGTHLCAGLTLAHYNNFRVCQKLPRLLARFKADYPDQMQWGIHLLVSQHENGELTIGDSHEYGLSPDPFLRRELDRLILEYLDTFFPIDLFEITERWSGVYAKHPTKSYLVDKVLPGVTSITGVGGAGMTLSFGLAEKVVSQLQG